MKMSISEIGEGTTVGCQAVSIGQPNRQNGYRGSNKVGLARREGKAEAGTRRGVRQIKRRSYSVEVLRNSADDGGIWRGIP